MSRIARMVEVLSKFVTKFISIALLALGIGTALPEDAHLIRPSFADDGAVRPVYLPYVQHALQSDPGEGDPGKEPTPGPTTEPTTVPTGQPTEQPTGEPTVKPTTAPTGEPTTKPAPEPPQASAFFADMQWRTSSASLDVDAQGGTHVAYVYYHGLAENVPNAGVYQFCASDCGKPNQWQGVKLGTEVNEIQLVLTAQGQPRILYRTRTSNNGWAFIYGACDTKCTDPKQWTLTQVATNEGMAPIEISDDELPQRYFALDNSGRPRFVYNDRKGTHYGT